MARKRVEAPGKPGFVKGRSPSQPTPRTENRQTRKGGD